MISFCNQTEELTRQVMEELYQQESEKITNKLHSDVTWIGAEDGRCIKGRENVSEHIRNIHVPRCEIMEKEYQAVANSDDMYIVAGRIKVHLQGNAEFLNAMQRLTFIWKIEGGQFLLLHFHVSTPIDFQTEHKHPAILAGKETLQYIRELQTQNRRRLAVFGKRDQIHVLWNKEIVYIEAENTDSRIHCLHRDILSRESISDMEKKLGEDFIKTHRSFLVNSRYITEIKRYHLVINQRIELPIPEKKYREIKEKVLSTVVQRQSGNLI